MALKEIDLNMGPQHPSTHGVLRLRLAVDNEVVLRVEPVLGYLHRGMEKLWESLTYTQVVPLTDRLDYIASLSNNLGYVLAVEKLAGIEVPRRDTSGSPWPSSSGWRPTWPGRASWPTTSGLR